MLTRSTSACVRLVVRHVAALPPRAAYSAKVPSHALAGPLVAPAAAATGTRRTMAMAQTGAKQVPMNQDAAARQQSQEDRMEGGQGRAAEGDLAAAAKQQADKNAAQGVAPGATGMQPNSITLTKEEAALIQEIESKRGDGTQKPGGLAAQALSVADQNADAARNSSSGATMKALAVDEGFAAMIESAASSMTGEKQQVAKQLAAKAMSAAQQGKTQGTAQGAAQSTSSVNAEAVPMTKDAAARAQSMEAEANGGVEVKGGFGAKAMQAALAHAQSGQVPDGGSSKGSPMSGREAIPVDRDLAAKLHSYEVQHGGDIGPGSLAAMAHSVADRNAEVVAGKLPVEKMQALAVDKEAAHKLQLAAQNMGQTGQLDAASAGAKAQQAKVKLQEQS